MPDLSINTNSQVAAIENSTPQNLPSGDASPLDPSKNKTVSASDLNLLKEQSPDLYNSLFKSTLDGVIRQIHKQAEKSHQQRKEENGM